MKVKERVQLSDYSTMGIGGKANYFAVCQSEDELIEAVDFAKANNLNIHILGSGANTIFHDKGFDGLVIKIEIKRFELNNDGVLIAGAGEDWDTIVEQVVDKGFSGIEALSYIPGTVGAAPVQNIGAYGQELAETFVRLRAYDIAQGRFVSLSHQDLQFGYRTSTLKQQPGKFIITEVELQLHKQSMQPPFYTTLQQYFDKHNISDYTPTNVRKAVVEWRKSYLPDYKIYNTAGSFFVNPIVSKNELDNLLDKNPQLNDWPTQWYWELGGDKFKLASGRLADNIGLKHWHDSDTGMATWENSALILVNESATSYRQLDEFRKKYLSKIEQAYGITFAQEPVEV